MQEMEFRVTVSLHYTYPNDRAHWFKVINDIINQTLSSKVMALKKTSEVITISTRADNGTPATFAVSQIDLQLNPLDQEVFVVTGVKIDWLSYPPSLALPPANSQVLANEEVCLSTTRPTAMLDIGDSQVLAAASRFARYNTDAAQEITNYTIEDNGPSDTPDSMLDYIGIVATSDMFLAIDAFQSSLVTDVAVRVYGYRAKADSATYAALVQSEVLSS